MYLCKDGKGIRIERLTTSDVTFILDSVKHNDSGSYSCVYSDRKVHMHEVKATGNSIFIQVHSQPVSGMCAILNP